MAAETAMDPRTGILSSRSAPSNRANGVLAPDRITTESVDTSCPSFPVSVAQLTFEDLARGAEGERVEKVYVWWFFVTGEPRRAVFEDVGFAHGGAGRSHDDRLHALPPRVV